MHNFRTLMVILILSILLPTSVFAYSYGDPNQEEVAEDFKQIVIKLNASPPDWTAANDIYKARRSEIASHFTEETAAVLDKDFQNKNKEQLIDDYKGLLVKNLERRFTYALQGIKDYSESKLLLAKAKGTYETLQPYVQAKKPEESAKINTAFDAALAALGNPGLFGVGEKPADSAEFKKQTDFILNTIAPLFPFKTAGDKTPAVTNPAPADSKPAADAGAVHAPMERTERTNPLISVVVIVAVVLLLGGAIWYAKRKGII